MLKKLLSKPYGFLRPEFTYEIKQYCDEFYDKWVVDSTPNIKEAIRFAKQHKLDSYVEYFPKLKKSIETTFLKSIEVGGLVNKDAILILDAFPNIDRNCVNKNGETAVEIAMRLQKNRLAWELIVYGVNHTHQQKQIIGVRQINVLNKFGTAEFSETASTQTIYQNGDIAYGRAATLANSMDPDSGCVALFAEIYKAAGLSRLNSQRYKAIFELFLTDKTFNYHEASKEYGPITNIILTLSEKKKAFFIEIILSVFEKNPECTTRYGSDILNIFYFLNAERWEGRQRLTGESAIRRLAQNPNTHPFFGLYAPYLSLTPENDFKDIHPNVSRLVIPASMKPDYQSIFTKPVHEFHVFNWISTIKFSDPSIQKNQKKHMTTLAKIKTWGENSTLINRTIQDVEERLKLYISHDVTERLSAFSRMSLDTASYLLGETADLTFYIPNNMSSLDRAGVERDAARLVTAIAGFLKDGYDLDLYAVSGYWPPDQAHPILKRGAVFYEASDNFIYPLRHGMLTHVFQISALLMHLGAPNGSGKELMNLLLSDFQYGPGGELTANAWDLVLDSKTRRGMGFKSTPEAFHLYLLHKEGLIGDITRLFYALHTNALKQVLRADSCETVLAAHNLFPDTFAQFDTGPRPRYGGTFQTDTPFVTDSNGNRVDLAKRVKPGSVSGTI